MKTLIAVVASTLFAVSLSINAESHDSAMGGCQKGQMMRMMDNPDSRSMAMSQIAENPEMRHEMMQKMMQSMNMDMHQIMNNPEMRERMQKHMEMMQAMMDSDGMDQAEVEKMMQDPEMKEMMQMHMMGLQMINGGMRGEHSTEDNEEHAH